MTSRSGDVRRYPEGLDRAAGVAGRFLLVFAALAVLIWLALQVKWITTAAVIGFAEVSLLWPLVRWLRVHHVPRVIAAVVSIVALLGVFGLVFYFFASQVAAEIPSIADSITTQLNEVTSRLSQTSLGQRSPTARNLIDQFGSSAGALLSKAGDVALVGANVVGTAATVLAVSTFFAIFALTSGDALWRQAVSLLPAGHQAPATASFRAMMHTLGGWFFASTATGLVDGAFVGLGLVVLGVPLAVPIGALTFLLAYIPLVGATLAGVIAVAAALVFNGWQIALWALLLVVAVGQLEGNVLSPLLLSRAVNFHPLIILLLTTTGAAAFGVVGIFLAVPVVGVVVAGAVAYRSADRAEPPPDPPAEPKRAPLVPEEGAGEDGREPAADGVDAAVEH